MRNRFLWFLLFLGIGACMVRFPAAYAPVFEKSIHPIDAANPLPDGDADKGWQYIYYGNYIGSGYPAKLLYDEAQVARLMTEPDFVKDSLGIQYNAFYDTNGVPVIVNNCFTCHAGQINGNLVFGLGNQDNVHSNKPSWKFPLVPMGMRRKLGKNSDEYVSFTDIWRFQKEVLPGIVTPFDGPSPAFRLEEICASFRHPEDLTYTGGKQLFSIKGETPAADVPPLWHLKKKKALYYNGMGRGDFAKLLMQASVLGIKDSSNARTVLDSFVHVVAWAASLEPPMYPGTLDAQLLEKGALVFEKNCASCHGTYGEDATYPNKLIPLEKVKTDDYYARYFYQQSGLAAWYNASWFAQSAPHSQLLPSLAYIAPPLDGIWASAPYLHNGSVPTLLALLDSSLRPDFWEKDSEGTYDFNAVGLSYINHAKPGKSKKVYRSDLKGFGNYGHYFGDHLSQEERWALIEYLKSL